jgi:hypothetical protein
VERCVKIEQTDQWHQAEGSRAVCSGEARWANGSGAGTAADNVLINGRNTIVRGAAEAEALTVPRAG